MSAPYSRASRGGTRRSALFGALGKGVVPSLAPLLASCGHAPPAPPPIEATHVSTPAGVWFDEACTPTGPEICGNATDDNCNGLIDEGCGTAVGKVQFEVAWEERTAHVELVVSDPQGDVVDSKHTVTRSGLRRDRSCPPDDCHGLNVDNVVLAAERPVHGLYSVTIRLTAVAQATALPLKVRFGWRVGDRVATTAFTLGWVDDRKTFSFEM